tara:strand:- start:444 stop:1376 length:933 start_codon:yes stop_codon:yes gene_type:complete
MSNSLQDFIQQLKNIDVADLLEKAKTVKIDDIKKIKLSDILEIRKNKFFYPVTGLFLASLITNIFTIPAYKSMISIIDKSNKYSFQSDNFELLEEKLNKGQKILSEFNKNFNQVSEMVVDSESLIYLTRIIDESSKRSLIKISQFRPINAQELEACSTLSEEERAQLSESSFSNNFDDFSAQDENFEDDFIMDDPSLDIDNNQGILTNQEIENVLFSENSYNLSTIDRPLSKLNNNLSDIYKSNYFEIIVEADYLNIINFMKAIQEYDAFVLPYCFAPRIASNETSMDFNQTKNISGQVKAKIILNIPTN